MSTFYDCRAIYLQKIEQWNLLCFEDKVEHEQTKYSSKMVVLLHSVAHTVQARKEKYCNAISANIHCI